MPARWRLAVVVEAACRLVEQHHARLGRELDREDEREPLAFGQIARMRVVGDPRNDAVEQRARAVPRRIGFGVGLRELVADRVEVEQIARAFAGRDRHGRGPPRPRRRAGRRRRLRPSRSCAARSLQRPQQRRLPRSVAPHERDDLAARASSRSTDAHGDRRGRNARPTCGRASVDDPNVRRRPVRPGGVS